MTTRNTKVSRLAGSVGAVCAATLLLSGCVSLFASSSSAPTPTATLSDAEWIAAAQLYDDAICPINAARDALYPAIQANDLATIKPLASQASDAYATASHELLDHPEVWPSEVSTDIHFLGTTSTQLADSWGKVSRAESLDEMNAVAFPDAQTSYDASQRIHSAFAAHGTPTPGCTGDPSASPTPTH